jgi:hypothetical protein
MSTSPNRSAGQTAANFKEEDQPRITTTTGGASSAAVEPSSAHR